MTFIKRVGKFSALKVGFAVCALFGLLAGLVCSGFAFVGMPFGLEARMGFKGILGLLPLILCPLFYGIIGAVVTFVGALIYNLAAAGQRVRSGHRVSASLSFRCVPQPARLVEW